MLSELCVRVCDWYLAAMSRDDSEVSRDPVSSLHLHQVSCHHLLSVDRHLLALTDHQRLLQGEHRRRVR